jgi:hypothetical protein
LLLPTTIVRWQLCMAKERGYRRNSRTSPEADVGYRLGDFKLGDFAR